MNNHKGKYGNMFYYVCICLCMHVYGRGLDVERRIKDLKEIRFNTGNLIDSAQDRTLVTVVLNLRFP